MKKAFALLLALALIGGAVFAQEATMSGYGQVAWGFDLNNNNHGFTNAGSLTFDLPLVTGATKSSTGEGNYGTASVSAISINVSLGGTGDGTANTPAFDSSSPTITAKVVTGPLATTIYNKPSLAQSQASMFTPWQDSSADYSAAAGVAFAPSGLGGIASVYTIGDIGSVNFKLASMGNAGTFTAPAASDKYAVAAGVTLTPADLVTIVAGGAYNLDTSDLGATVKVSLAPAEGITSFVAADFSLPDAGEMALDARVNLAATFGKTTIGADAYFMDAAATTLNGKLMVSDTGTVEGLTFSLGVFAMDLLAEPANDPMKLGVANSLTYKVNLSDSTFITPYQKAAYDMGKASHNLYLSVGTTMNLIANTVFTLDYTQGAIVNKGFPATLVDTYGAEEDKGRITFTTRVSF